VNRLLVLGASSNFLDSFKAYGWYLDDLVLIPVNHLTKSQRKAKWLSAQTGFAHRIAEYQPLAIVSLLLGIKHIVDGAAIATANRGALLPACRLSSTAAEERGSAA
jgi:hypothetical protein